MQITIQIITNNNEKTIENTLNSIQCLNSEIIIADESSSDSTLEIIKKYNRKIDIIYSAKNKNITRNALSEASSNNWQFLIEPNETFKKGLKELDKIIKEDLDENYRVMVLKHGAITKPVRIWKKSQNLKFKNPIYEHLDVKDSKQLDCLVTAELSETRNFQKLEEWKINDPTNSAPFYYLSLEHLMESNYDEFLRWSEIFFFKHSKKNAAWIMMKYYQGLVLGMIKQEPKKAYLCIMDCIQFQPNMAEFWCLLGDIYYFILKRGKKAMHFYEQALLNGKKRNIKDEYPIELSKYKEYPEKMIASCKCIIKEFEQPQ